MCLFATLTPPYSITTSWNSAVKHCPEVSHPLFSTLALLSGLLRYLAYAPDSFPRPSLQRRHALTPETLTPRPNEGEALPRPELMSPDTVKTKPRVLPIATLGTGAGVSGLTCFLFEGCAESHCDDATCSVSAEVNTRALSGEREKGRHRGEGTP